MTQVAHLLPPPAKVVTGDQPAISRADISTEFHDEPRIHDLLLAERLGFKRPFDIRELLKRNADELRAYGALVVVADGNYPYRTDNSPRRGRRGPKAKHYWLNEGQALVLCALARTTAAARIRRELITVFMAFRSGSLAPVVNVVPQVGELEAMAATVDKMRAEVSSLNRRMGLLLDVVETQGRQLAVASEKAAVKLIESRIVAGPITPPAALLYGAKAIATYLNLTEKQVHSLMVFDTTQPARPGDTVVLWFKPDKVPPGFTRATAKQLVAVDALAFTVETLNPPRVYRFARDAVWAVHRHSHFM